MAMDQILTYEVSYDTTGKMIVELTPREPDFLLSIDFTFVGIISMKVGNAGMIEAIEAVGMITNCEVLSCKRM